MNDFTRLFEVLDYQMAKYPLDVCLAGRNNDNWTSHSTAECVEMVQKLALGLIKYGIKPGDKIAIISSNNRPEWNIVDLAVLSVGAYDVPIYPTISPGEYEYIMNDAEVKMVFVGDAEVAGKVNKIKKKVTGLEKMYTFDGVDGEANWQEIIDMADNSLQGELDARKAAIKAEDLATIIYTSGTTGLPKGVMLSHNNIVSNVKATGKELPLDPGQKTLSFLPLCHIFERMVTYTYMAMGAKIYYAQAIDTIGDDLKTIQPHFFTSVPRLLEKVFDKIVNKGLELSGIKKRLFFWALGLGMKYDWRKNQGWWYNTQLKLANKLIFSKWREALGGNIVGIVTGSAPLQERLARVFSAGNIIVREGYGLTETSPVCTYNRFDKDNSMLGTVGTPIDDVELKLDHDGEILIKGPNVMMGYYNKPEATAEVMTDDGWFRTGDIGVLVEDKFLKITDRKKQLMKTSGGKYVAPQPIEEKFKESMLIEQMMVVAEGRKFTSALIIPTFDAVRSWCEKKKIDYTTDAEMINHPRVQKKFEKICTKYNPKFSHVEQIKKFKLMPAEWTIDGGELTPTMKLKRKNIREKYAQEIEGIYEG